MAISINTTLCLAEAFGRHGVAVTFDQSSPSTVHLAVIWFGIKQLGRREPNIGGARTDGSAFIFRRDGALGTPNGEPF